MAEPTSAPAMPELFSCERLSARLTVKYCGSRFLRVRAATVGSADYDSACDRCPIGEHHAKHGTLCTDTHAQTPTPRHQRRPPPRPPRRRRTWEPKAITRTTRSETQ